jgi:paraquat-inducible protein B
MIDKVIIKKHAVNVSFMWFIPLVTLLIGVGIFIEHQLSKGPTITLIFDQAEDITADKTEIKAMNVNVGMITKVTLDSSGKRIIATAEVDKTAARMLREDTQFWMVKPRITKDGISGLSTLISGSYINIQQGAKNGSDKKRAFKVLNEPPIAGPDTPGLRVVLVHNTLGKLDVGDPVYFNGFIVGRVETKNLDIEQKKVKYQLFIYAPYNHLIYENTSFWLTKPFDLSITDKGFHFGIASLESLILGGVTFGLADNEPAGSKVTENSRAFTLFSSEAEVRRHYFGRFTHFIMHFEDSIRGLNEMAPVEYKGIQVGSVLKVPIGDAKLLEDHLTIPVLVSIDLSKLISPPLSVENLNAFFKAGLVAKLQASNLLTGRLAVAITFAEQKPGYKQAWQSNYPVFPTVQGQLAQIQNQLADFAKLLKNLSSDGAFNKVDKALDNLNRLLKTANSTVVDIHSLLASSGTKSLPYAANDALRSLHQTLEAFNEDGKSLYAFKDGLTHLDDSLQQLSLLLKQLNQKSNALIFTESKGFDPKPKGARK